MYIGERKSGPGFTWDNDVSAKLRCVDCLGVRSIAVLQIAKTNDPVDSTDLERPYACL